MFIIESLFAQNSCKEKNLKVLQDNKMMENEI